MTNYARVADGIVCEIIRLSDDVAMADSFHPDIAAQMVVIPTDVSPEQRWTYDGAVFAAPVIPPYVAPVPPTISDRQFFQQLAVAGIITQDQALASNAAVIPAPLLDIINAMPTAQQFAAKMVVSGATTFERAHPMTIAIGTAYGMTSDDIDAFFIAAADL